LNARPSFDVAALVLSTLAIKARAAEIYRAYGLDVPTHGHVRCPLGTHPDHHPSFRIRVDGVWFCTCGGGDVLKFVQIAEGVPFKGALARAREILGGESAPTQRLLPAERVLCEQEALRLAAIDAWHSAACHDVRGLRIMIGPEPAPVCSDAWWEWKQWACEIDSYEREIDSRHGRSATAERVEHDVLCSPAWPARGYGAYVRPRDSLPWLARLFLDEDGETDYARAYALSRLFGAP
jgi:hypothetical protein